MEDPEAKERRDLFAVVTEPISAAALRPLVAAPGAGAVCTFEGTVRDHTGDLETSHLEYEAYAPMAEKVFAQIAAEAAAEWPGVALAIHHRVGRLEIGDVSVAVAASSAHRAAAFDACRFAIDKLKASAPIWKKETGSDGSFWVEGPLPARASGNGEAGPPAADDENPPSAADS